MGPAMHEGSDHLDGIVHAQECPEGLAGGDEVHSGAPNKLTVREYATLSWEEDIRGVVNTLYLEIGVGAELGYGTVAEVPVECVLDNTQLGCLPRTGNVVLAGNGKC